MALTNPIALTHSEAVENDEPARISYVDGELGTGTNLENVTELRYASD